tara:strand:- start:44 stop:457 length:414 start_codon:yes stop_codon:yes gene_type:complete
MPNITVDFIHPLNESVQVGDILYYVNASSEDMQGNSVAHESSGSQAAIPSSNTIIEVGEITEIDYTGGNGNAEGQIVANIENATPLPTNTSFFFFGKDNRANMASLLGYYAEVEMVNNDTKKAELYSVGSEIFESSK